MSPALLPEDLYEEIVAYLWDDIPTLKACSLASRIMRSAGQRLLFSTVVLRPARNLLREEHISDTSGTSDDFERLLVRAPHIGRHVKSIRIMDTINQYSKESGGDDVLRVNDVVEQGEGKGSGCQLQLRSRYTHATHAR